jgi:hypothetical protein
MNPPLPPEIEVLDQWPESFSYRLPRRNVGGTRWFGAVLILAGLLVALGVANLIATFFFNFHFLWRGVSTIAFLLAIPTAGGSLPLWWGLGVLFGRRELVIKNGRLKTIEWVGPCWYSKAWPVNVISRFHVTSITPVNEDNPQPPPQWTKVWDALALFTASGNRGMLAWGYPQELFEPLAFDLCDKVHRALSELVTPAEHDEVDRPYVTSDYKKLPHPHDDLDEDDEELDGEEDEDIDEPDVPVSTEKPYDSPIDLDEFDDGLTITVPPAGLWKGTSGLFFFSLIWNGAMLLFTSLATIAWLKDANAVKNDDGSWIVALFFVIFWLIGIGLFLGALNMGLRRAAIAIAGDALMVIQKGPLGTKKKEWPLDAIERIAAGPSGIKVNDVDVLELQITDKENKKFGMLSGRKNEELYWLAAVLSKAVRESAPNDDATQTWQPEAPARDSLTEGE